MATLGVLKFIWLISAGLAILPLLTMTGLVILRAAGNTIACSFATDRGTLAERLLDAVIEPPAKPGIALHLSRSDGRILADTVETLLRSIDVPARTR